MNIKFTSEDLLKAIGLQVGDKFKIKSGLVDVKDNIYTVISTRSFCSSYEKDGLHNIFRLIDVEIEILPKPKKVGQLTCGEIEDCRTCPLQWICFIKIGEICEMEASLFEMLDSFAIDDQEIYDLLKARLDKEVKDDE
jgi:hypothetical protein